MTKTELAESLISSYRWAVPLQTLNEESKKEGLEPMEVFREMVRLGEVLDND